MYDYTSTPFKVVAHSDMDGVLVDHFETMELAESFARDIADEGYTAMVCPVVAVYRAATDTPEPVAIPGVDYPATLNHPPAA